MNHLVIGLGEVGSAVLNVLIANDYDCEAIDKHESASAKKYDVLHICIPYSAQFIRIVKKYQRFFRPRCIIIYSTVPIGTTKKIDHAVHSPVEGKHPRLDFGVKTFKRWIGYNDPRDGKVAQDIWQPITGCRMVKNSDYTEFLKLASTSKYGINIVWAQYMGDTAKKLGLDYEHVKQWDRDYNDLYNRMKKPEFRKFVLDPPDGPIGGHCITPNAALLDKRFPSDLLKMIGDIK